MLVLVNQVELACRLLLSMHALLLFLLEGNILIGKLLLMGNAVLGVAC